MDSHFADTDEINQCSHHDDRIRTNANANSVDEIIVSSHSEANRNVQENVNIEENDTRPSHNNCDHCLCHYCPHISDIHGSDNIRLQYLLNPLVFHHLLANISQVARTDVLTSNAGHQTEFSEIFSNDELISRPLASGMSAPEEEICKNDTDTSMLELEQFFNHNDKGDCQTHHANPVENPFLPSSSNSLLHSETPQLNREIPEGRGDKKKTEKVATRLQRQGTFVIEKKIGCNDNTEAHSK